MFQVTFSDQSMEAFNRLEMDDRLRLLEKIGSLTPEMLAHPREPLGRFRRGKTTFYRYRAGEFRCYFEIRGDTLFSHYILDGNTFTDFLFRSKLPVSEAQIAEKQQSFWKYLESLTK